MRPSLDVTEVLSDPDFVDHATVFRRPMKVNEHGEVEKTPEKIDGVPMVICNASGDDLTRYPEMQAMGLVKSIVTTFRLYGAAKDGLKQDYQPDVVRDCDGNFFVVNVLEPYTRYGAGFVQALATSYKWVGKPPQ